MIIIQTQAQYVLVVSVPGCQGGPNVDILSF